MYFISDTHFHHGNLIDYCDRPFDNVKEMNETLIDNWNREISRNDNVFFLGDLAMSRPSKAVRVYKKLNGNMVMIRGNHDDDLDPKKAPFNIVESMYFKYDGYDFYLSHCPAGYNEGTDRNDDRKEPKHSKPPEWFDGWQIHGHVHNNDIDNFPFVNHKDKRVNVSVDVINFKPISIDELISIIREGVSYDKR